MPEKDPRHASIKDMDPRLEDVGVFDDLNFGDFLLTLREHGVNVERETAAMIEVGSGKGKLLERLQREGYHVIGIEPRGRPEHQSGELSIRNTGVEDMPTTDHGKFDVVIADSVIDPKLYTHNPDEMIAAMFKLLKPGGILLYGLKGRSALPAVVSRLGLGTLLEERGDGNDSAYVFQKRKK
jgi:2-polyprenyl-3-methyl-5-hydroxy-6-metoxy-1,4-benzoquinol methylase